jgi:hypothetical protein
LVGEFFLLEKQKREKNSDYLKFIRTMPCVVMLCCNKSQAHHVDSIGSGGSDMRAVPLCAEHHTSGGDSVHRLGVKTFQVRHGVDFESQIKKYNAIYKSKQERHHPLPA